MKLTLEVHVYVHNDSSDDAVVAQLEELRKKLDSKESELKSALEQAQK